MHNRLPLRLTLTLTHNNLPLHLSPRAQGHAIKRASLLFEGTQQSLFLHGEGQDADTGRPSLMEMAQSSRPMTAVSPLKRASAQRRGSTVSVPSPSPMVDEPPPQSSYKHFSPPPPALDPEETPDLSPTSPMSAASKDPNPNPEATKRASARFSVKDLSAMKGRKSVNYGAAPGSDML